MTFKCWKKNIELNVK